MADTTLTRAELGRRMHVQALARFLAVQEVRKTGDADLAVKVLRLASVPARELGLFQWWAAARAVAVAAADRVGRVGRAGEEREGWRLYQAWATRLERGAWVALSDLGWPCTETGQAHPWESKEAHEAAFMLAMVPYDQEEGGEVDHG